MRWVTLIFLLGTFSISAQDLELGPVHKLSKKEQISGIFASDNSGFYALRFSNRIGSQGDPIIEKYTNKLDQKYSTPLSLSDDFNFQQVFGYQDNLYCTFSRRNKSTGKITYYLQGIANSTGKLSGKKIQLENARMETKNTIGSISTTISRDSSHIGFFSSEESRSTFFFSGLTFGKNSFGYNKFKVNVMDANMEEVWSDQIKLPYDNEDLEVLKNRIDNEGNLYILIRILDKDWNAKRRKNEPYKTYKILAYTEKGTVEKEYKIRLRNKLISDITFTINDEGNIVCSGFTSDSKKEGIDGAFYFVMNKDSEEFLQEGYKNFGPEELGLFMSERKARKGKEITSSYDMDQLILKENGGAVLLAEYYDVRSNYNYQPNGISSTTYEYIYGPILILSIDDEGGIDWIRKLQKRQISPRHTYSSYNYAIVGERIYFIYNKNISRRTEILSTYIDGDGKMGGRELFRAKDEKVMIRPAGCYQINEEEMIIYGEWRRQFQFGRLRF